MAATQYVGAHYVPHGWEEWNPNTYYDGLFCVSYNYSWFIAKQNVPVGISPVNTEYWAPYSLTTGAQQELEEFVRRYNPTESLPDGFDIDTVMEPGEYFFNNYKNLSGGPRYQFITNYPKAIKGTLSVRRCGDTFKPKYTILKRLTLDMEYPWVFTSSQTTNSGFSPWRIESSASFMTGAKCEWVNNVDVFATVLNSPLTKYYYFGTGCTNAPSMGNYFTVVQTGGQAFAFGGTGTKNTIAISYWSSNENRWVGWQNIPNSTFMDTAAYNHLIKRPIKTKATTPYEYSFIRKTSAGIRTSGLIITNNSGGGGRLDFIWSNNNSELSQRALVENNVSYTIALKNNNIVITSEDPYLDIVMVSTDYYYGSLNSNPNAFHFNFTPYNLI